MSYIINNLEHGSPLSQGSKVKNRDLLHVEGLVDEKPTSKRYSMENRHRRVEKARGRGEA